MPRERKGDQNSEAMDSAALSREQMEGFRPNFCTRLHGVVQGRLARWRLTRWCSRIEAMTDPQFAATLQLAVVAGSPSEEVQDPLDWLYRAMRSAGGKAGPFHEGVYDDHITTYAQPLHVRLVSAIRKLSAERYALLALFMWGARCEEVAAWRAASQEDVATRIDQIARELAASVFGTRP